MTLLSVLDVIKKIVFPSDNYRSFVAYFCYFLFFSLALFLALILFFIAPKIDAVFDEMQSSSDNISVRVYSAQIERYLKDRELLLLDITQSQYIINALLEENTERPDFKDYLSSVRLLGEHPSLTIFDFSGDNFWGVDTTHSDYEWIKAVLQGERSSELRLTTNKNYPTFQLAVPIIYGDSIEGVLLAEFNASPLRVFSEKELLDDSAIVVYEKDDQRIASSKGDILLPHVSTVVLDSYRLTLLHIRSWTEVFNIRNTLVRQVIFITLLGALMMFILLYVVGRQLLIRPYQELADVQKAIAEAVEGISKVDVNGCYVSLNNAYASTAGYTPEELKGKPWVQTVYADDIPMLEAAYATMLTEGKVTAEARGVKKTGEIFYKQVTMVSQYNDGVFIGHHCFMRDISSRKKVEVEQDELVGRLAKSNMELVRYQKELEKGEKKLTNALNFQSLIFSSIPDLVFVKDDQFRIVQANSAFLELYPENIRESVVGSTTLESYLPEEAEAFLMYDRQAFAEGFSRVEESISFPDGVVRMLDTKKIRFIGSDDKVFILGIARDITEIKNTQLLLEQSEMRYELAVKGSAVGLWDYDVMGDTLFWSDRFKAMVGINDEQFTGRISDFTDRLHPDDAEATMAALMGHMENKTPYDVEYRFRREDGNYIWLHAKGQAIWNEYGDPVRMAGSVDDISDKKISLIERENLIDKLAESNEWLEQFAFACSHDLQEPLRMVRIFSNKLAQRIAPLIENDETAQRYLEYVEQGAFTSQELIDDILEYSRIDRDHSLLQATDINDLLRVIKESLVQGNDNNDVDVLWDQLPTVPGNKTQLQQLFQNLITNGLKYQTADNKPSIHISVDDNGDYWQFAVKDNGIGIDPRYQKQIFDVFKRLHGRSEYSGSGIGLAICRKVIERHGGSIWVESELNKGAIFYFTLPKYRESGELADTDG